MDLASSGNILKAVVKDLKLHILLSNLKVIILVHFSDFRS